MEKTPKVRRGSKASPVKIIRADGSIEMQKAYDFLELRQIKGHGKEAPKKLVRTGESPRPKKNKRRRYVSVPKAARKKPGESVIELSKAAHKPPRKKAKTKRKTEH